MNKQFKRVLTAGLAGLVFGVFSASANNECIESGPWYYSWGCWANGSVQTPGSVSATTFNILQGNSILPPVLTTAPVFNNGTKVRNIAFICQESTYETAPLMYSAGPLYFEAAPGNPSADVIPGPFNTVGTYQFYARVNGVPSSVAGWWTGDSALNNLYTSGQSAQLFNGAGYAPGKVGFCFNFDGIDDYVKIPSYQSVNGGGGLTVDFWMKADPSNPMDTYQGLVTSDFWGVEISRGAQTTMGVNFFLSNNKGVSFGEIADVNGGGAPVSSGAWHHIAATWDGYWMKLYIDGVQFGNAKQQGPYISQMLGGSFISIGSEKGRNTCPSCLDTRFFKGMIDEVTVYNCALPASDVLAIYNAGSAGKRRAGAPPDAATLASTCICGLVVSTAGTITINVGDSDGDGLPSGWETQYGLDPNSNAGNNGASGNQDNDGLTNIQEYQLGLDPTVDQSAQTSGRRNYVYDRIDRLDDVTGIGQVNFTLDKEGNITTVAP